MTREELFAEIEEERAYQDSKWGTEFDDKNTLNDWVTYICQYATEAAFAKTEEEAIIKLKKATTLGVAALETHSRNNGFAPRHYDN